MAKRTYRSCNQSRGDIADFKFERNYNSVIKQWENRPALVREALLGFINMAEMLAAYRDMPHVSKPLLIQGLEKATFIYKSGGTSPSNLNLYEQYFGKIARYMRFSTSLTKHLTPLAQEWAHAVVDLHPMNLLTAGALFDQIVDKEGVLYKKVALYDTYPAQYNPVQLNDVACYDSAKDVVHAHANPVNPLMSLRTLGRLKIEQYNMRQLFLFHKIPLRERALLNFYNQDAVLLTASLTVRECEGYKNEHDIYHSFITKLFRDTPLAHPKKTSSANP